MKRKIIQSIVLVVSVAIFVACGTDNKENPPEPDGPYAFFDATTPLEINKPSTDENGTVSEADYEIAVTLLEYNLAKSGEEVILMPFSSTYGTVASVTVTTDGNGRAIFKYTAPSGSDFDSIRGQDITVQALYLDEDDDATTSTSPSSPDIILTQDFLLQFR